MCIWLVGGVLLVLLCCGHLADLCVVGRRERQAQQEIHLHNFCAVHWHPLRLTGHYPFNKQRGHTHTERGRACERGRVRGRTDAVTWPAVWIISLSRIQLYNELNLFCEPRRIIVQLNYVCGDVCPTQLAAAVAIVVVVAVSLPKDVPCRLWYVSVSGIFVCRINDLYARNCQ